MKFIHVLIFLGFLFFNTTTIQAQSAKEIGISTSAFQNFGFIYKKETKQNTFIRWEGIGLNLTGVDTRAAYNIGLAFGVAREKRRFINDKFAFIHGWTGDIRVNSSFILNNNFALSAMPSIGYLMGVHYQILDDLYFNLEINPAFSVMIQANTFGVEVDSYSLRANSQVVGINLMYQFKS
ncbi:MAG: hypothetical protein ACPG19_13500 [Saprospiraceae bacterium]